MSIAAFQKLSLWASLKSLLRNWFRRPSKASTPQLLDRPAYESMTKKRSTAVRTMRYIVMHSYRAMQRKRRGKAIKRKLSYVSAAILEEYGEILSRRERRSKSRRMVTPFQPYYN